MNSPETKKLIHRVSRIVMIVAALVFVTFVLSLVMVIQAHNRNQAQNRLEDTVIRVEQSTEDVEAFVDDFVKEREAAGPTEISDEELRSVFQMVADIKGLLCSMNPQSDTCN